MIHSFLYSVYNLPELIKTVNVLLTVETMDNNEESTTVEPVPKKKKKHHGEDYAGSLICFLHHL
jgi:hypothetical protein